MALPDKYEDWPKEAQAKYQAMKDTCKDLHQHVDVSEALMLRVNAMVQHAEEIDTGDGAAFAKVDRIVTLRIQLAHH